MPLQYNKAVLSQNIFTKGFQSFEVLGIPSQLRIITRDAVSIEQGVIELADKTKVPGGRNNAGEFTMTVQMALNTDRQALLYWYSLCMNWRQQRTGMKNDRNVPVNAPGRGQSSGNLEQTYKRDCYITWHRAMTKPLTASFGGSPTVAGNEFQVKLIGVWPSKMEFPDFSMSDGDSGDADAHMTGTFQYDDVEPQEPDNILRA
ncbi:MAG: hypothetical protein WBB28_01605 [Crinalium sp.]